MVTNHRPYPYRVIHPWGPKQKPNIWQASVAVKVTVSDPLAPQASLRPVLSLVQVTPEHPSCICSKVS